MKINENGLVAVRFIKASGSYMPGNIAGFLPEIAESLVKKNFAEDPNTPVKGALPEKTGGAAAGASKEPKPPKEPKEPKVDKEAKTAKPVDPGDVEIPEGWEQEHHLQQIAIAKKLKPDETAVNKPRAIEIITTEIERRKANEQ